MAGDDAYAVRRRGMNGNRPPTSESVLVEFEPTRLRLLIANEEQEHLRLLADVLTVLGHDVVARETNVTEVAAATARELPDAAKIPTSYEMQSKSPCIGSPTTTSCNRLSRAAPPSSKQRAS
jgi:CheY-like chemotaxis protein